MADKSIIGNSYSVGDGKLFDDDIVYLAMNVDEYVEKTEAQIENVHRYLNSSTQFINAIDDVFEYRYKHLSLEELKTIVVAELNNHTNRLKNENNY